MPAVIARARVVPVEVAVVMFTFALTVKMPVGALVPDPPT